MFSNCTNKSKLNSWRNKEQTKLQECLLSFRPESSAFQLAFQTHENPNIQKDDFDCCFIWNGEDYMTRRSQLLKMTYRSSEDFLASCLMPTANEPLKLAMWNQTTNLNWYSLSNIFASSHKHGEDTGVQFLANKFKLCIILGFLCGWNEFFCLLGCYAA
jgi:hypothetical protein